MPESTTPRDQDEGSESLPFAFGVATAFIGLGITLPLIGHATWHAYKEVIDSSGWPSHQD